MFLAEVEATNNCNTRCLYCPHDAMRRARGKMDWPTFETIVEKISSYLGGQRFKLSFSGMGEPLMNPLIYKFIEHASSRAYTSFSSNGAMLTQERVEKLIQAGLDRVYVSISADESKLFNILSGGLPFDRVLANLKEAINLSRGTRLEIAANIVITPMNQNRVPFITEILNDAGIDSILYSPSHTRGGNISDPNISNNPSLGANIHRCDVLQGTLFVDWQGKVHVCDHDLHDENMLGDLMTEPLETIIARRDALLKAGLTSKLCMECNDVLRISGSTHLKRLVTKVRRMLVYDFALTSGIGNWKIKSGMKSAKRDMLRVFKRARASM